MLSRKMAHWLDERPKSRRLVGILLALSCTLNVTALFLPFVDVHVALEGKDTYDLLHTVELLWKSGLPVLAVVVVAFSIVFPFAKLGVLARVTLVGEPKPRDGWLLSVVEGAGKWSMIDVFIVCFLLGLTSDQWLIGASLRPGLLVFLFAIMLSLISSELLGRFWHDRFGPSIDARHARETNAGWPEMGLLTCATLAWLGLLFVPFLAIDDWLLRDNEFTLARFLLGLGEQGAPSVAVILGLVLVAVPLARYVVGWWWWIRRRRGLDTEIQLRWLPTLRRWSMLDVFLAALAVFLLEGEALMSLRAQYGVLLLTVILITDLLAISRRRG